MQKHLNLLPLRHSKYGKTQLECAHQSAHGNSDMLSSKIKHHTIARSAQGVLHQHHVYRVRLIVGIESLQDGVH